MMFQNMFHPIEKRIQNISVFPEHALSITVNVPNKFLSIHESWNQNVPYPVHFNMHFLRVFPQRALSTKRNCILIAVCKNVMG